MGKQDNDYYIEIETKDQIELPSTKEHNKKQSRKKSRKLNKRLKWIGIFIFILFIYLFYNQIILFFLDILKSNPTVYENYLYIESEIANKTLKGLFFVAIMGSVFFLVMPSEALFIYYLTTTDHLFIIIIALMLLGNLTGMIFNYLFGRVMGEKILKWMFGEKKFFEYKEKIDKYGGYVVLFGNILPGPIEVLAVFYGGFKFNFTRYIYLCFIGRILKYLLIYIAFLFFWDSLTGVYSSMIDNFLILKDLYI